MIPLAVSIASSDSAIIAIIAAIIRKLDQAPQIHTIPKYLMLADPDRVYELLPQ